MRLKIEFTEDTIARMNKQLAIENSGNIFNLTKGVMKETGVKLKKNIVEEVRASVINAPYINQDAHYRYFRQKSGWVVAPIKITKNATIEIYVFPKDITIKTKNSSRVVNYAEWINYGHYMPDGSWWSGYHFIEKATAKTNRRLSVNLKKAFLKDLKNYSLGVKDIVSNLKTGQTIAEMEAEQ